MWKHLNMEIISEMETHGGTARGVRHSSNKRAKMETNKCNRWQPGPSREWDDRRRSDISCTFAGIYWENKCCVANGISVWTIKSILFRHREGCNAIFDISFLWAIRTRRGLQRSSSRFGRCVCARTSVCPSWLSLAVRQRLIKGFSRSLARCLTANPSVARPTIHNRDIYFAFAWERMRRTKPNQTKTEKENNKFP